MTVRLALLLVVVGASPGCTTEYRGRLPLATNVVPESEPMGARIAGESCWSASQLVATSLSFGLFGQGGRLLALSIQDALAKAPAADGLADVDIRIDDGCYRVEGTPVKLAPPR